MSHYMQKNKNHLFGIGGPFLALLLLVIVGLSVAPGWVKTGYSAPGTPCSSLGDCDVCNLETCTFNSATSMDECADGDDSFTNPPGQTPACPVQGQMPGCWTECTAVNNEAECGPSDQFCLDISGGLTENDCRTALCQTFQTPDVNNPSGCDYEFDSADTLCINCEPPLPVGVTNCGNGVCEKPDEDPSNCSLDCRVPGFAGTVPASQTTLDNACTAIIPTSPVAALITFNGPPFNIPGFPFNCEDGDICTNNVCDIPPIDTTDEPFCDVTPKTCDAIDSDLCCPVDCEPPVDGDCTGVNNCDIDCLVPETCTVPTPTPTPTPPSDIVQGSGQVFNCSFLSGASVGTVAGIKYLALLFSGIGGLVFFRRRAPR